MCKAMQEWLEEERMNGVAEGLSEGIAKGKLDKTKMIIRNMLIRGFNEEDICAIAECERKLVHEVQSDMK